MAIPWLWVRLAVVVALPALLAVVWGAVIAPPKPPSTILNTRGVPAVIAPGRALDNEDD